MGYQPLALAVLKSTTTRRIYSLRLPSDTEQGGDGLTANYNASKTYGDGGFYGSQNMIAGIGARVLQFGAVRESLTPQSKDLLASLQTTEIGSYTLLLDNLDLYFSRIMKLGGESFLNQELIIAIGFRGLAFEYFEPIFTGKVTQEVLSYKTLKLMAQATLRTSRVTPTVLNQPVWLLNDGVGVGAQETKAAADIADTFFFDTWRFVAEIRLNSLTDGVIFELLNAEYSGVRLQIGVDASNYLYVKTGHDLETSPSETTYTDTRALTVADVDVNLMILIIWDNDAQTITFSINAVATTPQATGSPFDQMEVNDDTISVSDDFDGDIRRIMFGDNTDVTFALLNYSLTNPVFPDLINGLDITVVDGTWGN